jgi:two-component system LytT family sensor kinase
LLRRYLAIQQARFGERLRVTIRVDEATRSAWVPVLLLQPLVENAIRHGLAQHLSAGRIDIVASRQDGRLVITVTDDGPGPGTPAASGRQPVGLGNTRARLEALYGSHQRLELAHAASRGAKVSLEIPFRTPPIA